MPTVHFQMKESKEAEPGEKPQPRKRRKWIRPKSFKIADEDTLQRILNPPPKPKPEFPKEEYVEGLKNECKFIFMCNEPNCGAKFTTPIGLTLHGNKHLNPKLKCTFCNMRFKADEIMEKHTTTFHPDLSKNPDANPLQCQKCGKCSRDKTALWRHVRESHRDRTWSCPHCDFPFTRPENLKEHLRTKHPPKGEKGPARFSCKTCGKEFSHNTGLRCHIRNQHRGKSETFRCVLCHTIYTCRATYRNHMKRHVNPKYVHCTICNVKFMSGNHLRRHRSSLTHRKRAAQAEAKKDTFSLLPVITTVKTAVNPNLSREELIELCKKTVVKIRLHRVDQHIMNQSKAKISRRNPALLVAKHVTSGNDSESSKSTPAVSRSSSCHSFNDERDDEINTDATTNQLISLNCMYCDEQFLSLEAVKSHEFACFMKIRSKKVLICHICNKEFDKPFKLKTHLRTHTDERPFPCSYCKSFFKSRTTKIQHEKSAHFGIRHNYFAGRVFKCPREGCSKEYKRPEGLRKHEQEKHLQIRYYCEKCDRSYMRIRNLKDHLRLDHGKSPLRLQCKPCNRTYKTRTTYLSHSRRNRHFRKTREYEKRQNKEKGNTDQNSETSDALLERSSANTVA